MLLAAARHREGIGVHLEALGGAALLCHAARDLGRAVRRAVVDEHDPLDGAEERRQDPGQRVGLVLRADDGGEARRRVGL